MQSQLEQLEKDFGIKWQEYVIGDLFDVLTTKKKFNAAGVEFGGKHRYVARGESNNGIRGYISEDEKYLNEANTISFGQDTATMFYQSKPYFTGDKIKVFSPKQHIVFSRNIAQIFISAMNKAFSNFSWGSNSYNVSILKATKIQLPTIIENGKSQIAFDFMEKFIATLNAERLATLNAYLTTAGLKDYVLTDEEQAALDALDDVNLGKFNLEALYGKSSRGRRLKSADRIDGVLPFVTAGEADMGISAYIANAVHIFEENTVTIDMFGSSKYRNYKYGADDHVAVVHTETLPKFAAIYLTAAIHKSSHAGQFDYSRNFYASDADELNISLPINHNKSPDYDYMSLVISAMQKVVIKNMVDYLDVRIEKTIEIL